jgi:predicted GIY-YIG superfamily endonuclease
MPKRRQHSRTPSRRRKKRPRQDHELIDTLECKTPSPKRSYVYVLQSQSSPTGRIYVGWTYDVFKRFREHNGLAPTGFGPSTKGAKRTRRGRPWKLLMYITAPPSWLTKSRALRLEWTLPFLCRRLHKYKKNTDAARQYQLDATRCFKLTKRDQTIANKQWIKYLHTILWMIESYHWLFCRKSDWISSSQMPHQTLHTLHLRWKIHPDIATLLDWSRLKRLANEASVWSVKTVKVLNKDAVAEVARVQTHAILANE